MAIWAASVPGPSRVPQNEARICPSCRGKSSTCQNSQRLGEELRLGSRRVHGAARDGCRPMFSEVSALSGLEEPGTSSRRPVPLTISRRTRAARQGRAQRVRWERAACGDSMARHGSKSARIGMLRCNRLLKSVSTGRASCGFCQRAALRRLQCNCIVLRRASGGKKSK